MLLAEAGSMAVPCLLGQARKGQGDLRVPCAYRRAGTRSSYLADDILIKPPSAEEKKKLLPVF